MCYRTSYYIPHLYIENGVSQSSLRHFFLDLHCVAFAKIALIIQKVFANHYHLAHFLMLPCWTK